MLKTLNLSGSEWIGDGGVVALTQVLLAASRTSLKTLGLADVGMGDGGMLALARAIRGGCFIRLENITVGHNGCVSS